MSTLVNKLARSMLADQGISVIWKLHADAATLARVGNYIATNTLCEIADTAEREWLRQCGETGTLTSLK